MERAFNPIIDGHADTLVRLAEEGGSLGAYCPHLQLDLPRLKKAGVRLQVMAICAAQRQDAYAWAQGIIARWREEYAKNREELVWIRSGADLLNWSAGEKVGVILALEGLEPLAGELSRLVEFYEQGVRMCSLTWNGANPFASGVGVSTDQGLTLLGRDAVRLAEELGLILDLSHLGPVSFHDLMSVAHEPVCVSHANVYAVCAHRRNLTKEQIAMVAATGGTVGLTFYPPFIGAGELDSQALLPHLEGLLEAGGVGCPALGSDFDGIDCTPADLPDVTGIPRFLKVLEEAGLSRELVAKVAGGNLLRFLQNKFSETS